MNKSLFSVSNDINNVKDVLNDIIDEIKRHVEYYKHHHHHHHRRHHHHHYGMY